MIDPQKFYGHTSFWRQGDNLSELKLKMLRPKLFSRVEQWNQVAGKRVKRTNIWSFIPIAAEASQGKIVFTAIATMLPRHNIAHIPGGHVLLNDTSKGEVLRFDLETSEVHACVSVGEGYLRGLLPLEDGRVAVGAQQRIVVLSPTPNSPAYSIRLSDDPRESVHSIELLPEGFAGVPTTLAAA